MTTPLATQSIALSHLRWLVRAALLIAVLILAALPAALEAQRRSKPPLRQTSVFEQNRQIGKIYYPANASAKDPERRAAETLAHYLEKISAQKWEVLPEPERLGTHGIFIGKTRRAFVDGLWRSDELETETGLPTDRIDLKVKPSRILIVGENPLATLSGIYRFLQRYAGADWFAPGEYGEEIPTHSSLRIPQGSHHWQPDFRDRRYYFFTKNPAFGRWREQMGMSAHFDFNHNLHRIFTPEVYASHPEYWASINGIRPAPKRGERNSVQLDYTNPDVARITAAAANDFFTKNPDRKSFSLGINDTIDFGNDPATLAVVSPFRYWRGHPVFTDLVFAFANDVAQEVAKTHPDRYLPMLAYMWAEAPPSFPLEPNLFPCLCIDHGQWYDPQRKHSDMELTRQWAKSGATQLGSWEYYGGSGFFIPRIFTEQSAQSLKFIHNLGYDSIFFEDGANTGFDAPKMWLAAQLLWDIDADPAALLEHFYTGYYGAAAAPMRQFFELCEQQWMQQQGRSFWLKYYLDIAQAELYPPAVLAQLQDLLDEAKNALQQVDAPERFFQRLKLTEDSFAYLKAAADFYHAYRELLMMPLDSAADLERFVRQYTAFTDARNALKDAPQTQLLPAWDLRPQMLQHDPAGRLLYAYRKAAGGNKLLTAPLIQSSLFPATAAQAKTIFAETFSNELIKGDSEGIGPTPPVKEDVARGWNVRWTHHENAHLQRILPEQPATPAKAGPLTAPPEQPTATQTTLPNLPLVNQPIAAQPPRQQPTAKLSVPQPSTATPPIAEPPTAESLTTSLPTAELPVLKLQNQEFLSIYRWLPVPEAAEGVGFSLEVMGQVNKGARAQISLSWLDADHKPLGKTVVNILPPEPYPAWHGIAVAAAVPSGAKWFYLGFRIRQQGPGQPLYLRNWQAFSW